MKNLLFGLVSLFLIPSVQLFSSDFRNDPKMQLMDGFADARKYVREASGEQCFEELRNFSTKDLKKDHIIDFHQAFKALTEPGHTLKEYQYNYFKALLLSGFIAKQMQNEHNQAKQQIVNHYSSIYQHLSLIQKQVRQPQTLLFENLFGYSGREDVLLCRLKGSYAKSSIDAKCQDPLYRVARAPCLCLDHFWGKWLETVKKEANTPPFYLWLLQDEKTSTIQRAEGNDSPPLALNHYAAKIEEGKVLKRDGMWLYVFKDETLHMRGGGHHDAIIGNVPVESAGIIGVIQNKISHISNHSGHYFPSPFHLIQVIKKLKKKDVFAEDAKVEIHYVNEKGNVCLYKDNPVNLKDLDLEVLRDEFKNIHYFATYKTIVTEENSWLGNFTYEEQKKSSLFNLNGNEIILK